MAWLDLPKHRFPQSPVCEAFKAAAVTYCAYDIIQNALCDEEKRPFSFLRSGPNEGEGHKSTLSEVSCGVVQAVLRLR